MQATMMNYPLTLAHILDRASKLFGASEIVSRLPDKSLHRHCFSDFHRRTLALGGALQAAGLGKGDRVATLMWNHYAHLEAYFAIPCAGGVLHTLNQTENGVAIRLKMGSESIVAAVWIISDSDPNLLTTEPCTCLMRSSLCRSAILA